MCIVSAAVAVNVFWVTVSRRNCKSRPHSMCADRSYVQNSLRIVFAQIKYHSSVIFCLFSKLATARQQSLPRVMSLSEECALKCKHWTSTQCRECEREKERKNICWFYKHVNLSMCPYRVHSLPPSLFLLSPPIANKYPLSASTQLSAVWVCAYFIVRKNSETLTFRVFE